MRWNWQLGSWPKFKYDPVRLIPLERKFLLAIGKASAYIKTIEDQEYKWFVVEILTDEGQESSKIEGELLDRESLQSSIKKHFGLPTSRTKKTNKEAAMADLLCDVYDTFEKPLTDKMLFRWHTMLFKERSDIEDRGKYRSHAEPMQIISNRLRKVVFEAPPSKKVSQEMSTFIRWFNSTKSSKSILERAALVHIYFESIHPFEDGNGRIGRALVEKTLSQAIGQPILIAASKILEKRKKEYYAALERCNRTLDIQHWMEFFSDVIIQAHAESMRLLTFLIQKSKMLSALGDQINPRQMKALVRMFQEGPEGFIGGLSAEKYISITKTTRATATRDLTDLVEKGALMKTGELRHTRYWLKIDT